MKNTLHIVLVVFAVLVLAAGIFFAGVMFARATPFGFGSMMGGSGGYGPGGMMGGGGPGGMMGGSGPGGMMGGGNANSNATPLTIDQMKAAAETYIKNSGLDGLEVGEIMVFNNNAYASVVEKSTMMGAFELLADSGTQIAYPEYGPNMMWNLKYGGMSHGGMMSGGNGGGMMGGNGDGMTLAPDASAGVGGWNNGKATPANVSADMPVTIEQAIANAQAYLDQYIPGAKAAADPMKFYGYYTLDFEQNGKVAGMLSVNGYNGQVFLHTWHGTFVEESGMKMK